MRNARLPSPKASQAFRVLQARTIIQALWDLPDLPPPDDPEVQGLLADGDPLTVRYAKAMDKLGRAP